VAAEPEGRARPPQRTSPSPHPPWRHREWRGVWLVASRRGVRGAFAKISAATPRAACRLSHCDPMSAWHEVGGVPCAASHPFTRRGRTPFGARAPSSLGVGGAEEDPREEGPVTVNPFAAATKAHTITPALAALAARLEEEERRSVTSQALGRALMFNLDEYDTGFQIDTVAVSKAAYADAIKVELVRTNIALRALHTERTAWTSANQVAAMLALPFNAGVVLSAALIR